MPNRGLDCIVIGYNETPFERYEELIRVYGEDSEAYRDLKLSFVEVGGRKMNYVDLLNHVAGLGGETAGRPFRSGEIPNLAAAYLTHYLRRRGLQCDYINLFQDEKGRLAEHLADDPVCIAITTTFYILNFPVTEMVDFIRRCNPRVPIVVGGPLISNHVRNYAGRELEAALEDIGADIYVIESQGEHSLLQIVQRLRDGGDLAGVPNLLYREDGRFHQTPRAPENNSLDENFIDWHRLADRGLGPTLQTRTARSCAFSCSFCNYPARAGKLTLAGLETITSELDSMRELGVENVVFIDDTFNVPLPRFKEICRLMIERRYGFRWFSYFRCSNADEETVELMAKAGCTGVFLGIESGSPSILEGMSKKASEIAYRRGIEWLRRHGILTFGSFIIGFPGETAQTVRETEDFIRETGLDFYRAQMWYCEPGTPIFNHRERYQIEGTGFVWRHATMESQEAMDHIERLLLAMRGPEWLPQWSFDFWIIPYLIGRGLSLDQFRSFMTDANRLLALEIASLSPEEKREAQQLSLNRMVVEARQWPAGV